MSTARKEYEVRRLLTKCELMIKQQKYVKDARLEELIDTCDELVNDLKSSPDPPSSEALNSYIRRVKFLKSIHEVNALDNTLDKAVAMTLSPKAPNPELKSIQQVVEAQIENDIRGELFNSSSLRHRRPHDDNNDKDSAQQVDTVLQEQSRSQDKIAENILTLTRSMKEQSILANNIIKKDTESLEKASRLADSNFDQLKVESDKLQVQSSKAWQCWIWILLVIVIVIFVNMVLFMKVAKKI